MNMASPRSGLPLVATAACWRRSLRSSTASAATPTIAAIATSPPIAEAAVLVRRKPTAILVGFEPKVEQADRRSTVHQAARDPHNQAGKLLVGRWVEADAG